MVNKFTAPGVSHKIHFILGSFSFASHFPSPDNAILPPRQLFMCVLWFLLQLVVIFLYWDLPLQEQGKTEESAPCCSTETEDQKSREERDKDDDEEEPLMISEELVGSYGSVVPPHTNHTFSPPSTPQHCDKPSSPGFFSSRGASLTAC